MGVFKDITGQMFGNWKVIKFMGLNKHGSSTWECECQCKDKTKRIMSIQILKKSKDCGCSKLIDLTGRKIGRWTVIGRSNDNTHLKFPRKTWDCVCDCGTHKKVTETRLINNTNPNLSCGCATQYKGIPRIVHNKVNIYDEYVEIDIGSGNKTIVDIEDYDLIKDDYWCISLDGYAVSCSGRFTKKRLHRVLMGCENTPHVLVDHIDRDKLNNRRHNLRIVTAQQNAFNQSKRSNNKSGVIGVCWWDRDKNWLAQIKFNYKRHFLGYYDKFEDAVRARLRAELEYFGAEFAPQRHLFEKYGIEVPNNER